MSVVQTHTMFSRSLRAETRSKTKEDLKRVNKSNAEVRKWEKKWVAVKDTSMLVFKWVPCIVTDAAKKTAFNRPTITTTTAATAHTPTTGLLSTYNRPPTTTGEQTGLCNGTPNATNQSEGMETKETEDNETVKPEIKSECNTEEKMETESSEPQPAETESVEVKSVNSTNGE